TRAASRRGPSPRRGRPEAPAGRRASRREPASGDSARAVATGSRRASERPPVAPVDDPGARRDAENRADESADSGGTDGPAHECADRKDEQQHPEQEPAGACSIELRGSLHEPGENTRAGTVACNTSYPPF